MKKTLLLCILLAQSLFAAAQIYVEGVRLDPTNTGNYIEIDPSFRADGSCAFRTDYGQSGPRKDFVSDVNGKKLDFRSLADGLNFFHSNGWEVLSVSVVETNRRFLLQRR
jgi:hypothetical protein